MPTERTVLVRLKASVNDFVSGMGTAAAAVKGLSHEINTTNERTAWMAQGFLALAPALVPIGAVAVPAITTLATQFGLAAAAAGVGIWAFQGVGTALKALNTYELQPTAANLEKMHEAMRELGPAGADFARFLNSLRPQLNALQDTARQGLFPGVEQGLQSMMSRLPEFQKLISDIAGAMGDLAAGAGAGISGKGFDSFFSFLDRQARPLLEEMGHTIGNFIQGLAAMAAAFEPLTVTFSHGFLEMSRSFQTWADGLSSSSSFNDFVNYAITSLPKVGDFLKSVVNLFVQLAQAAAPVGSKMLPALTDLLNVMAKLADTPLGSVFITLAASAALWGRAVALASITTGQIVPRLLKLEGGLLATSKAAYAERDAMFAVTTAQERASLSSAKLTELEAQRASSMRAGIGAYAQGAAAIGLLALSMSDLDDKMGATNATMGAFMGLVTAGPIGAGIGAVVGSVIDLTKANDGLDQAVTQANLAMKTQSREGMVAARTALQQQLADVNTTKTHWYDAVTGIVGIAHSDLAGDLFSKLSGSAGKAQQDLELVNGQLKVMDAGSLQKVADAAARAATQVQTFKAAVAELDGWLNKRDALRGYQAALDDFRANFKHIQGDDFNIKNAQGNKNQQYLDSIVSGAEKAAEALHGLQRTQFVAGIIAQLRTMAQNMNLPKKQIDEVIAHLRNLDHSSAGPPVKISGVAQAHKDIEGVSGDMHSLDGKRANPKVEIAGATSAHAVLNGILGQLHFLDGYTAHSYVTTTHTSIYTGPKRGLADGGVVDYYVQGGIRENHVAEIAPRGTTRVWNEPETEGEAYIPLAMSKRARSQTIAAEVVARLGGQAFFANGGMWGQSPAPAGPAYATLSDRDVQRIAAAVRDGSRIGTSEGVQGKHKAATAASRLGV